MWCRAEAHHQRVPHELVDRALVRKHHLGHGDEAAVQHLEDDLGGVLVRDRHEPAQVGEEDGELAVREPVLPLLVVGRDLPEELRHSELGLGAKAPAGLRRDDILDPVYGVPQIHAALLSLFL